MASGTSGRRQVAVNTAARDLGALVMLRGIDAAQEVYARESRMLARSAGITALARQSTLQSVRRKCRELSQRQTERWSDWTSKADSADLQSGMRYQQRPSGGASFNP